MCNACAWTVLTDYVIEQLRCSTTENEGSRCRIQIWVFCQVIHLNFLLFWGLGPTTAMWIQITLRLLIWTITCTSIIAHFVVSPNLQNYIYTPFNYTEGTTQFQVPNCFSEVYFVWYSDDWRILSLLFVSHRDDSGTTFINIQIFFLLFVKLILKCASQ